MKHKKSVKIQRFSSSTLIKDCDKSLWEFLGLSYEEVYGIDWRSCAVVEDFGEIWSLAIGRKHFGYFHNLPDLLKVFNKNK